MKKLFYRHDLGEPAQLVADTSGTSEGGDNAQKVDEMVDGDDGLLG